MIHNGFLKWVKHNVAGAKGGNMIGYGIRPLRILIWCWLIALAAGVIGCGEARGANENTTKVVGPGGYYSLISKHRKKVPWEFCPGSNPFTVEPLLNEANALAQRSSISETQDQLILELNRRGNKPRDVYKFKYTPYLAMTVDSATIEALLASPIVVNIQEDVPAAPTWTGASRKSAPPDCRKKGLTGQA